MASGPIWVAWSNGSPTLTLPNDALSASTRSSWRLRGTMMRVSDEQTWPLRNVAMPEMVCAAWPMS
jgi:hypothetical protein